jgi:hypothetical protein
MANLAELEYERPRLRVLDLFSGLGGWSRPFRDRGHEVVTLDLDPRFRADHVRDIRTVYDLSELERSGPFNLVLASPPCEAFSVASISAHWTGGRRKYVPRSAAARRGLEIMDRTFALIDNYRPYGYYVIENPRGVMRKVAPWPPTATTWFCQWDDRRAKPTDLWTNVPLNWPTCRNGAADHEAAPRGARAGTQGLRSAAERAHIPYKLSLAVCRAVEDDPLRRRAARRSDCAA